MNLSDLGITKEEVLSLTAQKLADEITGNDEHILDTVSRIANEKITALVGESVRSEVQKKLSDHLDVLLSAKIVPVDMWGDKAGEPTTIRDQLTEQARKYWDTKVNQDGKPGESYSCKPRHEWLFGKLVAEQFSEAIKQNITNIVGALKTSLQKEAHESVLKHIDKIIQVKV